MGKRDRDGRDGDAKDATETAAPEAPRLDAPPGVEGGAHGATLLENGGDGTLSTGTGNQDEASEAIARLAADVSPQTGAPTQARKIELSEDGRTPTELSSGWQADKKVTEQDEADPTGLLRELYDVLYAQNQHISNPKLIARVERLLTAWEGSDTASQEVAELDPRRKKLQELRKPNDVKVVG